MSNVQLMMPQNSQYSRVMNLKYRQKYKKLKQQIKDFVFVNAALCDEVSQVQADLAAAREERRYLVRRLMRHEGVEAVQEPTSEIPQPEQTTPPETATATATVVEAAKVPQVPKKRGPKKRAAPTVTNMVKASKPNKTKAPRQKMTVDPSGRHSFPMNLSSTLMLHMAGEIFYENPNFHTANWIYPVGYVATRIYAHPKDTQRKCVYTCKILNNAGAPQFQLIPDNDFDSVFFGETPNHCHQALLEEVQRALRDVAQLPMHVQGERFFGLDNASVMTLLQTDANFKHCTNFQGFLVDGGYANEEKDPTLTFEALQLFISISAYNTVPEVKDEPPDELLE